MAEEAEQHSSEPTIDPQDYFDGLAAAAQKKIAGVQKGQTPGAEAVFYKLNDQRQPELVLSQAHMDHYHSIINIADALRTGDTSPAVDYLTQEIQTTVQDYRTAKAIVDKPIDLDNFADRRYQEAVNNQERLNEELRSLDLSQSPTVRQIVNVRAGDIQLSISGSERGSAKIKMDAAEAKHSLAVSLMAKISE